MGLKRQSEAPPSEVTEEPPAAGVLAEAMWRAIREAGVSFNTNDVAAACGTVLLRVTLARAAQSPETLAEMRVMLEAFAARHHQEE